jgi:hypothetical protein
MSPSKVAPPQKIEKNRSARNDRTVYMPSEYEDRINQVTNQMISEGINVYDVRGNLSFALVVRRLIDERLGLVKA